jgi:hypothetical protein
MNPREFSLKAAAVSFYCSCFFSCSSPAIAHLYYSQVATDPIEQKAAASYSSAESLQAQIFLALLASFDSWNG